MVAIGSPFTTDMMVPQDNVVDLLVCPSYSTMCDLICDPKHELYKSQQYVIAS